MLRHQVKHAGVETALPHEDLAQISPGECLDKAPVCVRTAPNSPDLSGCRVPLQPDWLQPLRPHL